MKNFKFLFFYVLMCLVFISCSHTPPKLQFLVMPKMDLQKIKTIYVIRHAEDTGGINDSIVQALNNLGFKATTSQELNIPDTVDAVITYDYYWLWDLGSYLSKLKLYIRTPDQKMLIAQGITTSNTLGRLSAEEFATEILKSIFNSKT